MIQPIMKDIFFLQQKSEPATQLDVQVGQDLQDTLVANAHACVGMAANMIGIKKRIIIVNMGFTNLVMYNPVLISKAKPYQTEEGCLSLKGTRPTTCYQEIEVEFFDASWKKISLKLTDFQAQIVQHELDHLEGIII
ncbi:TPA: peptide deformylase [Streptococcus suis]|nr:peptide deformylase [Streptococcus suis]HEL2655565.1 peptide deformylase [Streptococcus suis]